MIYAQAQFVGLPEVHAEYLVGLPSYNAIFPSHLDIQVNIKQASGVTPQRPWRLLEGEGTSPHHAASGTVVPGAFVLQAAPACWATPHTTTAFAADVCVLPGSDSSRDAGSAPMVRGCGRARLVARQARPLHRRSRTPELGWRVSDQCHVLLGRGKLHGHQQLSTSHGCAGHGFSTNRARVLGPSSTQFSGHVQAAST
jgi:hypothetical protein